MWSFFEERAEIVRLCRENSPIEMVFPAGFEPAAFHLGGERSILLSYGNRPNLDSGVWTVSCQEYRGRGTAGRPRIGILRVVADKRFDVVTFEFSTAVQEREFHDEKQARNLSTGLFHQIDHGTRSPSGCE